MKTARCPSCGAAVRPAADWCSLCYFDLRRARQRETEAVAARQGGSRAPLVEAALEPEGRAPQARDRDEIVDAEVVEFGADVSAGGHPAGTGPATWPCACGASVSMAEDSCPDCGRGFLADLRDSTAGKHRRGHALAGAQPGLLRSRGVRIAVAVLVSLILAVAIPLIVALLG